MMTGANTAPIEFRSVSKYYGSGARRHVVFDNLSLTIGENEFVAIVGGSGCGKTTLLNMAAGFTRPNRGTVLFMVKRFRAPAATAEWYFSSMRSFPG